MLVIMQTVKHINKKTQDFRLGFLSGASRSSRDYAAEDMVTPLYTLQNRSFESFERFHAPMHWKNLEHILELSF